jgi:hypothetical protein
LAALAMAEKIVERSLLESMTGAGFLQGAPTAKAAERVRQFAALIGQSVPGRTPAMLEKAKMTRAQKDKPRQRWHAAGLRGCEFFTSAP